MSFPTKIQQRKAAIVDMALALGREFWVGDVADTPMEQELFRPAFHELVADGVLEKRRRQGTAKVYYALAPVTTC